MQNLGVTNKEHYGMLWYFLEWSIKVALPSIFVATPSIFESLILQQISLCFKSVITHALHIDKTLLRYHFLGDRNKVTGQ